jgi:nucleotide-binding universal stress UspA family protein
MKTFSANYIPFHRFAVPEHILVATDLSDEECLTPHVVAQAKACGARVTLLNAIMPFESYSIDAGAVPHLEPVQQEEEVRLVMRGMADQIRSHGIACEVIARIGLPAETILDEIESSGATRLIMATHGRGRWGQLMLGSVANQLLDSARIPIFAIGPHSHLDVRNALPRRILHPVSMTENYQTMVRIAVDLAKAYGAELTLLHVPDRDVEQSIHPGCTLSWAENLAALLIPEPEKSEVVTHIHVAFGNKAEEIRKEAASIKADWIVMGVEETFSSWPLAESAAYKVLAAGDCPVLAIPHELLMHEKHRVAPAHSLAALG